MISTPLAPGTTVKVSGIKAVSVYPRPTVATADVEWEPAEGAGTGGVLKVKYDPSSGTFPVGAVGTVLEVSDVLDGTYVKVIVGTAIGWVNAQRLEVAG